MQSIERTDRTMANTEFEKRQNTIKKLTDKAITEITSEDIVNFWGELTGGIITTNYHTGEIKFEDAYDWAVYNSIEAAAEDGIYTILEWALDGDEDAVKWLLENGIDIEKDADDCIKDEQNGVQLR